MHCKEQISSHHLQWILTICAVSVKRVKSSYWSLKTIYQASSSIMLDLNHAFPCLSSGAALLTSDPLWLCSLFQKILLWSDPGDYIIILSFSKDRFFYIRRKDIFNKQRIQVNEQVIFIPFCVACRIPWLCSVQMHTYTGLCKHTNTCTCLLLQLW